MVIPLDYNTHLIRTVNSINVLTQLLMSYKFSAIVVGPLFHNVILAVGNMVLQKNCRNNYPSKLQDVFISQKASQKVYEQHPEAVQAWLDEQCPDIKNRAKSEDAETRWGDETAVADSDIRGRCYAPVGKTPVTFAVGGTRQKLSMIRKFFQDACVKNAA